MKILELFCGTKSFSNVALELGHEVFTVDFNNKFKNVNKYYNRFQRFR